MFIRSLSLLLFSGSAFAPGSAFAAPSFPVLTYSTYLRDSFTPAAIAVDPAGNIYMAGNAVVDPATSQSTVLVVKLNPQATQYLYVRYLGGTVNDSANAIAVDGSGNVYVAGSTRSPDFPTTAGGNLGTPPSGVSSLGVADQRSFVVKLDANGVIVFSDLLGGSAVSSAQAIAVNGSGRILITGSVSSASASPFPVTVGAYNIPDSAGHPWLLELDSTGTKNIFAATGIGGSSIALDPAGNIYVAGTTSLLDYPTTPGTFQPVFPVFRVCSSPSCGLGPANQGLNQYVSKIDPSGSKLIYSTAISGPAGTSNAGLAVDAEGNAYITGYSAAGYPWSGTPPAIRDLFIPFITSQLPFLTKLNPAGEKLLFSVPVGGAGVQVDAAGGAVYAGGALGLPVETPIPALAGVPAQCVPIVSSATSSQTRSAYVAQVDSTSGNVLGSQYIGGATLSPTAVALSGSTLWIAGATILPDFPFTPNALTIPNLGAGLLPGAYLGGVDFSQPQPPAGTPSIGCILDSSDLAPVGVAARYQLLTIFGTGLGPAAGVAATDYATTLLGGVNITVGSDPAVLLYASSTQINLAVPLLAASQSSGTLQLTVNGVNASARQLPLTFANPSLFLDIQDTFPVSGSSPGFIALSLNADGSVNSSANPAQLGSAVSVYLNGLARNPQITTIPPQLYTNDGWSVLGAAQINPFVLGVNLQVPSPLVNDFACLSQSSVCAAEFTLYDVSDGSNAGSVAGEALRAFVYVKRP
jgi:uncharacterized protein (TIGR03437 family)